MATCAVCGTDLPVQRGPRARRYCSRACQQQAYRTRQAQRDAHRIPPGDEQRLVQEYADVSSRQLAASLSLAAGRVAGALTAGQPADDFDLGVLARVPTVLAARAHQAAVLTGALPTPSAEPTVMLLDLADQARPLQPDRPAQPAAPAARTSRDDRAQPAHTAKAPTTPPRSPSKASRDDSAPLPTWDTTAIKPVAQKLPKKRAQAVIDAAELVRAPDYRESHMWVLRSGDTLIGYVVPSYGGVSRSGRNGWTSSLGGTPGPRCHSRDGAKLDLAARWLRVVTAAPRRTLTGRD
jgi:hypothetical protein